MITQKEDLEVKKQSAKCEREREREKEREKERERERMGERKREETCLRIMLPNFVSMRIQSCHL